MSFELTDSEREKVRSWIDQHQKDHPMKSTGAIGGRWTYMFTPTSIGVAKRISCCVCNEECDVTDYDQW